MPHDRQTRGRLTGERRASVRFSDATAAARTASREAPTRAERAVAVTGSWR
jgi:hypothetical protein